MCAHFHLVDFLCHLEAIRLEFLSSQFKAFFVCVGRILKATRFFLVGDVSDVFAVHSFFYLVQSLH